MRVIIDWYIKKYWCDQYLHKDDLAVYVREVIEVAKNNEEARLNHIFEHARKELIDQHERMRIAEVEELNAEISRLTAELQDMAARVKQASEVYYQAQVKAKINARISSDMGFQANKILEAVGTAVGAIRGIERRANDHLKKVLDDDRRDLSELKGLK